MMLDKTTEERPPPGPNGEKKVNPFAIDKQEVGSRIRTLRNAKQMTQVELSRLVGKARPTIAQWEEGKASPDLGYLNALAFYLDSTPQFIAFGVSKSASDAFRVPVMDYSDYIGKPVGEMSIDVDFHRSLHLSHSARLRAYRLPRANMLEGYGKGSVILIDESDKTMTGTGEAVLIHHKVPAIAYANLLPGRDNAYVVHIGGQRFNIDGGLPVIGRVVAVLKSFS